MKDKVRLGTLLLAFLAACGLASVIYRFSREEFIVDRCLSANHGSFNYSNMSCDLETNHPYIPYQVRYPRDKETALVALVSFAVFLSAYVYMKRAMKKT